MKKQAKKALAAPVETSSASIAPTGDATSPLSSETTQDYDSEQPDPESYYEGKSDFAESAFEKEVGELFKYVEETNRKNKDLKLWAKDATNARPLSGKILDPIINALQRRGYLQVNAVSGEGPLSDKSMARLFGEDLENVERALGRLVLDAIIDGDRQFSACVDAAVKDSDILFHRGTSLHGTMNEKFFRWHRGIPDATFSALALAEVRRQFERFYRALNHREWTALQRTFHLHFKRLGQARRGRPPKTLLAENP